MPWCGTTNSSSWSVPSATTVRFPTSTPTCSKASALAEWAGRLGIAREEILAIGDNLNDREMLDFAGLAVVMGNASPGLKSLGWPVTLSNDEGGVAAAIEQYVLADRHP